MKKLNHCSKTFSHGGVDLVVPVLIKISEWKN